MLRLLIAGTALLIIASTYFLLRGDTDGTIQGRSKTADRESEVQPVATPSGLEAQNHERKPLPTPIRMRGGALPARTEAQLAKGSIAEQFENEAVDRQWSETTKEMIQSLVTELVLAGTGSADIVELDCRTQNCLLRLRGEDEPALVKLVDALQDERGFLGKAESMMLGRDADGIAIYLRFPTQP